MYLPSPQIYIYNRDMLKLLFRAVLPFLLIVQFIVLNGCSKDDGVKYPGAISGIVTEEGRDDVVLSGAQIILSSGYMTFSDERGKFGFANLLSGRYMLQCYVNGYVMEAFPISVFESEKTFCEIDLEKGTDALSVSSTIFDFGTDTSIRNLTIYNNTDIPEAELVTIETVNPDSWLTVTPESIILGPDKSGIIELKADRSLIKKNEKSLLIVKGFGKTIYVLASVKYKY